MYRVASFLVVPKVSSSSATVTELSLPAVDLLPCRPIILLLAFFDGVGLPVSSAKCHGDLGREAVARVLRRRCLASVLRGRRSFACRMRRKLWALRKEGGWIALESPAAAVVVVSGEGGSMAKGARGVSPADVRSPTAPAHPSGRASFAALSKAFAQQSYLSLGMRRWPDSLFLAGWWGFLFPAFKGSRDLFVFSFFLVALCVRRVGQLYSVSLYGDFVPVRVFVLFLTS